MSNLLHVGLILIISKVFTILCLLCLCSNREYPGKFENKISNECPCKVRGKTFLKWTRSIDLSSELHLYLYNCIRDTATYSSNVNYYKSVDHPIPTLPVGTGGSTLAIFKSISKLSFQLSFQICSLLAQTDEERKAFFGRVQEGGPHCKIITWLI